jgi:hypothetical protein
LCTSERQDAVFGYTIDKKVVIVCVFRAASIRELLLSMIVFLMISFMWPLERRWRALVLVKVHT